MFKIALTAGHYKYTAGKRCLKSLDPKETREWVLNARICDKIEKLLAQYDGVEILRTDDRNGEKNITLEQRTTAANKWGANFYLSIHHNAGIKGGKGGGIVAYTYTKVDAETAAWQKALYDALIKHTGLKGNRAKPLSSADLHECRETQMPAVLLELGFMDSLSDTPKILTEAYADQCAAAIVEVIVNKAGLKKKATERVQLYRVRESWANSKSQVGAFLNKDNAIKAAKDYGLNVYDEKGNAVYTHPKQKTVEDIAKEVIAGKWGNGLTRRIKLSKAGYKYSEVQNAVNRLLKKR